MSALDELFSNVVSQFVGRLPEAAVQRVAALAAARGVAPQADAIDRLRIANYIVTGSGEFPDQEELQRIEARNVAAVAGVEVPDYPHTSGDVTVLGPEIFASTPEPTAATVINWRGENFTVQPPPDPRPPSSFDIVDLTVHPQAHPDDPGPLPPEVEAEASGTLPEIDPLTEPAPMAGTHWAGRRGQRPG